MKKSAVFICLLNLICAGSAFADRGGSAIKECIYNASGLTYTEQLMSLTSCLRTVPSPLAQNIVKCVETSIGDDLNQTSSQLQSCVLSIDGSINPPSGKSGEKSTQTKTVDTSSGMLGAIVCIKNARGITIPQRIDTGKACLMKLPLE